MFSLSFFAIATIALLAFALIVAAVLIYTTPVRFKSVMRYDPSQRLFRIGRFMWTRGTVGDGKGYSVKLSLALVPSLFLVRRERDDWLVRLLGIRAHMQRSWGGIHA